MKIIKNADGKIVFKEVGDIYFFSDSYIGEPYDVGFIEGEGAFRLLYRECSTEPVTEYSQSSGRSEICSGSVVQNRATALEVSLKGSAQANYAVLHNLLTYGLYAWISLEKLG